MKNNKGFIAISLIYSFFLVFLLTLLIIALNYSKNRILLSEIKRATQEYLDDLAEFNPISLEEGRTYTNKEVVTIGAETWKVIEDKGDRVVLILNRNLTNEEIMEGLEGYPISDAVQADRVLMCYNKYISSFCNYGDSVTYNYYIWENSIVKKIVDNWFSNDAPLQKGVSRGTILEMEYEDGYSISIPNPSGGTRWERIGSSYNNYVRIPIASESSKIDDSTSCWYLSIGSRGSGISKINNGTGSLIAHTDRKSIRPVITVKKVKKTT